VKKIRNYKILDNSFKEFLISNATALYSILENKTVRMVTKHKSA